MDMRKEDKIDPAIKNDLEKKKIIFVYTTCPNIEEARSMGLSAIKEKLAFSADFWVIESLYQWHEEMQDVSQYMLMLTSEKGVTEKLIKFITSIHSYSTPMIAACDTEMVNKNYAYWADSILLGHEMYEPSKVQEDDETDQKSDGLYYGKLK